MARPFSHPNFGNRCRVEQVRNEVRLIFVAATDRQANDFAEQLVMQLKSGALNLTLMGMPTGITEERGDG